VAGEAPTQVLICTRGIPASGKTTWAKEWVDEDPTWRVRVNRDDLRYALSGTYVFPKETARHQEETVTANQMAMVETNLRAKLSVVVDDTNLTHKFAKEWLRLAKKLGVKAEFVDFDIPLDEALARNLGRQAKGGRFVPENVIKSFYDRFVNKKTGLLKPYPILDMTFEPVVRKYVRQPDKPKALVVDIDGTIADMEPCGRGPFEWHRVGDDSPHADVIDLIMRVQASGVQLIFLSGRDSVCRPETYAWLVRYTSTNQYLPPVLYMRGEGDMRSDQEIKPELFWKHVGENWDVIGVVDDRQKVVDQWRAMGLRVYQCAPGDF
jgi:predicted kinase